MNRNQSSHTLAESCDFRADGRILQIVLGGLWGDSSRAGFQCRRADGIAMFDRGFRPVRTTGYELVQHISCYVERLLLANSKFFRKQPMSLLVRHADDAWADWSRRVAGTAIRRCWPGCGHNHARRDRRFAIKLYQLSFAAIFGLLETLSKNPFAVSLHVVVSCITDGTA
jgi:hypothetical protein